jgi:hypothetical protein
VYARQRVTRVYARCVLGMGSAISVHVGTRKSFSTNTNHSTESTVSLHLSLPLPVAQPTVVWVKLPDGAVLFAPETEVYYGMNPVAACVWELLPESDSNLDKLCSLLYERFPDASLDQIRSDVIALLEDMEQAGLVAGEKRESAA